jgi:hypothetical protein
MTGKPALPLMGIALAVATAIGMLAAGAVTGCGFRAMRCVK